MSDDFQVVTRKKWIATRSPHNRHSLSQIVDKPTHHDAASLELRIKNAIKKMAKSLYFAASMATLNESLEALQLTNNKPKKLLCLGIGSYSKCFLGRHQLAFILKVKEEFQLQEAIFYDPVFSALELKVLKQLGGSILPSNTEAKHLANEPMLYYMPHCTHCLSNNLLWANWRPGNITNVVVICNSFSFTVSYKPERILRLEAVYMLKIIEHMKEFPLDDDFEYKNVFNNLSVHVFPKQMLPDDDDAFWAQLPAPKYPKVFKTIGTQTEMVFKSTETEAEKISKTSNTEDEKISKSLDTEIEAEKIYKSTGAETEAEKISQSAGAETEAEKISKSTQTEDEMISKSK